MKPESADYLAEARECLEAARTIGALPLPQVRVLLGQDTPGVLMLGCLFP